MLPDMLSTGFMGAENAQDRVRLHGGRPRHRASRPLRRRRSEASGRGRIFAIGTRPAAVKVAKELRRDGYHQLQGGKHRRPDPR